jgi:hypothetical protein
MSHEVVVLPLVPATVIVVMLALPSPLLLRPGPSVVACGVVWQQGASGIV